MNKRQLEYFISVMEYGSIKEASEHLYISSQGLSKMILQLEEELGNQLFIRTKQGLKPTMYAMQLKPHALNILHEYESIEKNSSCSSEKKIFNVVCTYGTICLLGSDFIQKFYCENPHVQLNLVEMTDYPAIEKLAKNEVELAILPSPLDTTRFRGEHLLTAHHCLIIHKDNPLSQKEEIEYKDLNGQPLALKGREYVMYNNNINRFLSSGNKPTVYMETSSDKLIGDLAERNIAIGVSLDYIADKDRRENTVIRPFADKGCVRNLFIAQPVQISLSDTARSFKKLVIEHFKEYKV